MRLVTKHITTLLLAATSVTVLNAQIVIQDNRFLSCLQNGYSNLIDNNLLIEDSARNFTGRLNCANYGIESIEELKYFTNVTEIYLSNNLLTELPTLQNIENIDSIDLSYNKLTFSDFNQFIQMPRHKEIIKIIPQKILSNDISINAYTQFEVELSFYEDTNVVGMDYFWYKSTNTDTTLYIDNGETYVVNNANDTVQAVYEVYVTNPDYWHATDSLFARRWIVNYIKIPEFDSVYYQVDSSCNGLFLHIDSIAWKNGMESNIELPLYLYEYNKKENYPIAFKENTPISFGNYKLRFGNDTVYKDLSTILVGNYPEILDYDFDTVLTCEESSFTLNYINLNQNNQSLFYVLRNTQSEEFTQINVGEQIFLEPSSYSLEIHANNKCISYVGSTFDMFAPDSCNPKNEECLLINSIEINDIVLDSAGRFDVSVPYIEAVTYNWYFNSIVAENHSSTISLNLAEDNSEVILEMNCPYSNDSIISKRISASVSLKCASLIDYNIKSNQDCESISLAIETVFSKQQDEYSVIAENITTRNSFQLFNEFIEVEEGSYILYFTDGSGCKSYNFDTLIINNTLNCGQVIYIGSSDPIYMEGNGKAELINEIGEVIMEVELPYNWHGEDENGNLLPMGVYGLKRNDGSIETLTVIR